MHIRPALRFSPEVFSVWLCVAYQPRSVLRFIMYGQHFASPPFSPFFQLLIISVDQCTIECKVSSIVCSFIYCCRGKKMLDPSPFSLPKISPPPHTHTQNKRHNPVFDQGEVFPRQQWGSHPVSGTSFFSVSFRFNFMGLTKGETKKHQIEFT